MPLLCLSVLCRIDASHFLRLPNPRISSAVSAVNALPLLCSSEPWLIFAHLCLCMAMHISAFPFLCPASQILAQAHLLYGLPFRGTSALRFAFSSQCHATAFLNLASRFPLKACPCRASAIQIPAVPWLFTGFLCRSRDSRIRRQSGPFPATQIYSVACHNLAELIRRNSVRCFSDFFPSETSLGCVPPAPKSTESSIIEPLTDCVHVTVDHALNGELQLCASCYRLGVC